ncbi:hypothetical protein DKX38_006440 [Salix brachista]|uniref:Uncharacterized protein n=1 Tax=Salix brachista TaxID=2182728 RepID=A0A5N5N4B4_9ROSI|nr:hypothetical protein DKX38_006440 [Salix brachista]
MADVCRLLRRNLLVIIGLKLATSVLDIAMINLLFLTSLKLKSHDQAHSSPKLTASRVTRTVILYKGFDATILGDGYGFGDPDDIRIPFARNVCSSVDDSSGWTFFNLNDLFDEHRNSPATILQADFYHANELLPLKDEHIATKVMSYLSKCVKDLEAARVTNEKSYVSGLEAASRVVDFLGEGNYAKIIPLEEDEPHIQALRNLNRNFKELMSQFPLSDYLLQ